ncbi:hypothetical protein TWF225_001241 [Orbilia oligospora]|nr:hypothetical protein TWF225_001241 [Orbilia oligospora]KAF3233978.1 hypothetical protein TWF128_002666 [Orbilia oligospora]
MGPRNLELPSAAILMSSGPNERQKKWIYQSIHSRFLFSVSFFLKFSGCAAAPQPRLKSPPLKKKRKGTSRDGYNVSSNGLTRGGQELNGIPILRSRTLKREREKVQENGPYCRMQSMHRPRPFPFPVPSQAHFTYITVVVYRGLALITSNRFHSGFKFKYLTICDNYPFIDVTIPTFHLCLFWGEAGPDRDMGLNYSVQSPI